VNFRKRSKNVYQLIIIIMPIDLHMQITDHIIIIINTHRQGTLTITNIIIHLERHLHRLL
jgi:hypothetical protein